MLHLLRFLRPLHRRPSPEAARTAAKARYDARKAAGDTRGMNEAWRPLFDATTAALAKGGRG